MSFLKVRELETGAPSSHMEHVKRRGLGEVFDSRWDLEDGACCDVRSIGKEEVTSALGPSGKVVLFSKKLLKWL